MPRAFWKGVISFGLVAIPVKMYVGTESKTISFHLLHKKCLTRPKQVLHCERDNEYFGIKETVRGYEVAKEQYIVLDERDFERVPIRSSHTIDILGFAEAKEIDPIYYSGVHYLEPEELGTRPFQLLKEALKKTGRVGIGKVSFQRREHLGCLRPLEDMLLLHTLHYEADILPRKETVAPQTKPTGAELELNRAGFARVGEVALWLKETLDELQLLAFVKTSGKTGIHVYIPIMRRLKYKAVRSAAEIVSKFLVQKHPREITTEWSQEKRNGKVFLDYGQNVRGKTLASVYSTRPSPDAAVSTPLRWDELGKVYPTDFTLTSLPGRLAKTGDLWAEVLSDKQDLSSLLRKNQRLP